MRRFISLCVCLLPSVAAAQPPAKYAEAIKGLEVLIERERQENGVPGMSIAIVEDQSVIWAKGFGHADRAKTKPAAPDTVYRVGSVSKLFTDVAVMQLVEEGKLDLDKPVTDYLPDFRPENPSKKAITLRQLMAHWSGLVREPPIGNGVDANPPSLEKTVASLNSSSLVYEPGARIKYSNAAVAVVGRVVEKVDGRPFATALRERVLVPLGMTASAFERTAVAGKGPAEGLMGTYHGREYPAPTFELGTAPAACLYSSATDLARFMSTLFAAGKGPTGPLVKEATLKDMLSVQFARAGQKHGFGLGVFINDLDGHRRVGHDGAIYGFAAEFSLLPDDKLGVIVLANKDLSGWVTSRIGETVLRHILAARAGGPLPTIEVPKPVSRELARKLAGKYGPDPSHELIEGEGKLYYLPPNTDVLAEAWTVGPDLISHGAFGTGTRFRCDGAALTVAGPTAETFARQDDAATAPSEPPDAMRGLIGEYGWDHFTMPVFEKDGRLHVLLANAFLYPLTSAGDDTYWFPKTYGLFHGERVSFRRDASGKGREAVVAGVAFPRRALDGEDGKTFRIRPLKTMDVLRGEAEAAKPPGELGEFRKPDLVELVKLDPTIKTDLRYASDNNFMGRPLYPKTAKAYMQKPAAEALVTANQALAKKGYGLWVFDSYRPWRVTKMFWEATPESMRTFVADPSKGSRHNRGCAVDLTLYDLKTGKPVEMVSGYDEFSDRAYPNYWGGTSRQRWHQVLLRHAMEDAGFRVYEAEWWHFDHKDWRAYPIGNVGFEELTQRRKDAKEDN
jgi:CubicO group peptidase (beta-lactamase class C family)/D-alanyl-D-alanine dipeptidase